MGILLSSNGSLTESQRRHAKKIGKDPEEYLKELKKLAINGGKPKEKKVEKPKEFVSKGDKEPKQEKTTWKRTTAR